MRTFETYPDYFQKYYDLASIYPLAEFLSTEDIDLGQHAVKILKEVFLLDKVDIRAEKLTIDPKDPFRQRVFMTFCRNESFAGKIFHHEYEVKMDVSMAIFLAEKVKEGIFHRPRIKSVQGSEHLMVSHVKKSTQSKVSNWVFRQLYPESTRRQVFVDGDTLNLCNWNIYPKPFVSFLNMVRFDGKIWYLKMNGPLGRYRIAAPSEEILLYKMRPGYEKHMLQQLDVNPIERKSLLFGSGREMKEYYEILDRLKRWSPTKDLSPYIKERRQELKMWSLE